MNGISAKDVATEINRKRQRLSQINQDVTTYKTKNSRQEFENWKLEDRLADLKSDLDHAKANIDHLRVYETDSLQTLADVYAVKKKEVDVEFNEKLLKIKDSVADQVKVSIARKQEATAQEKADLEAEIASMDGEIQRHKSEMNRKLIKLKEDHHRKLNTLKDETEARLQQIADKSRHLEVKIRQQTSETSKMESDLKTEIDSSRAALENELQGLQNASADKENTLQYLRNQLKAVQQKTQSIDSSIIHKEQAIEEYTVSAAKYRGSFDALESQRRVLHNKLQELKGNIRVFCRIRPCSNDSPAVGFDIPPSMSYNANGKQTLGVDVAPGDMTGSGSQLYNGMSQRNSTYSFNFDKVFSQKDANIEIFSEISQLIQSCLDGFNVCVFAYGQTGSGKTWTMSHENDGMIPLSITKIFSDIENLRSQGWEYTVDCQFVEIYNETIIDLLAPSTANVKYEIKHDDNARTTFITNCSTFRAESSDQALSALEKATGKRSTASTMANSRSSRSHFIFVLKLKGFHAPSGKSCDGTLNLVDLAGSERLNSSQAKGDRLKETQAINKSLSCLGDVIHSLGQQGSGSAVHVPFRNSKLTYLLKHSLGGDSKTLMFVNISPLLQNASETINSLRFATKVNDTKLK